MIKFVRVGFTGFCLSLLCLAVLSSVPLEAQTCLRKGDVNQDGRVTPVDALRTFRHVLGIVVLGDAEQECADVLAPQENLLSVGDALCILQTFLGLPSCLTPEARAGGDHFVIPHPTTGVFAAVQLDGSGSLAPAGTSLRYHWTIAEMPPTSSITEAALSSPDTVVTLFTPDVPGLYRLSLTVTTESGATARATVLVNAQIPDEIVPQSCSCQGVPGETIALAVRVVDANGNPIAQWPVSLTVTQGDSLLQSPALLRVPQQVVVSETPARALQQSIPSTAAVFTDADGIARVDLRLGEDVVHVVEARAVAVSDPAVFVVGVASPVALAVADDSNLLVVDEDLRLVFQVDTVTGERTVISGRGRGRGPEFEEPRGIVVEDDRHLIVVGQMVEGEDSFQAVVRVERRRGDRQVVSALAPNAGMTRGDGPGWESLEAVARATDGTLFVVDSVNTTERPLRNVTRVDPQRGDRTIVTDSTTGSGPLLRGHVSSLLVAGDGNLVLVNDTNAAGAIVRVTPDLGTRSIVADATHGAGPALVDPVGLTLAADGTLVVVDADLAAVLGVDPSTGNRRLISGADPDTDVVRGSGPLLIFPGAVVADARGTLTVLDDPLKALVRIEPESGNRTLIPLLRRIGTGPPLFAPAGLALEAPGDVVVADNCFAAVVRISPTTGQRSVLSGEDCRSGATVGTGPLISELFAITRETAQTLLVTGEFAANGDFNQIFSAVVRVDTRTGVRSLLSGTFPTAGIAAGTGATFQGTLSGVALETPDTVVVLDDTNVVRVHRDTGNRTVIADGTLGPAPQLEDPQGIAVESDGHILVTDGALLAVIRIDPGSAQRTVLSGCRDLNCNDVIGQGPLLAFPRGIVVEAGGTLLVADLERIMRIDPRTGERQRVSGCFDAACSDPVGSGPAFAFLAGLTLENAGQLLAIDAGLDALLRVELQTGNRRILSR